MNLPQNLINKGFALSEVIKDDLTSYLLVKKCCYKNYVEEYYGRWIDDVQTESNTKAFAKKMEQTCFLKILLNNETVGFLGFNETENAIENISMQMLPEAQNQGIGSCFLECLVKLDKPLFLRVFKSNPSKGLYERFGFRVCDVTPIHYYMEYAKQVLENKCPEE